ncbi:tRNA lysidine(34) synthetase TilS [Actinomycetes bacterium KLBMP 9759]
MNGPGPAIGEVRRAVLAAHRAVPVANRAAPVLVACSGGADSLALAAAALSAGLRVHAAVVDHGLQHGSARQAAITSEVLVGLGAISAVHAIRVDGSGGPEAAARRGRYAALHAARPHPDSPVLLGHTLDDQAETVLLGLGRGSGARSIAGMREWDEPWLRPLLGVPRSVTVAACAELGLTAWQDPHNADPRFTRVRLRHEVLPLMEDVLAGGVAAALARTAAQLREDADALDAVAADRLGEAVDGDSLLVTPLSGMPTAIRRRVVRLWLVGRGVSGLTDLHLRAAERYVTEGPDRGGAALPGGLELVRAHGRLAVRPVSRPSRPPQEDVSRVRR